MASAGGQDRLSPYQAMGNNPVSSVDPGGTRATQIVDQKLIEFNPSPVIYGQVAVNGPPVGYTPEAMEMMGGYTVFTSDWTEGLSNQVSQQVWIDVGDILIDINGEGVAVPGIMTNLTMDAGSGSGGDGFSGGDPPSGDGKGNGGDENPTKSDSKNDIQVGASDYANVLQDYYESKKGGTYHISIWRFYDMVDAAKANQAIEFEKAKYDPQTGIYTVPVNFYKTDYWASYGRATLQYEILDGNFKNPLNKIHFMGFHDTWDLDPKPWGTRSLPAEMITRWYNSTLNGQNFNISYP